MHTITVSTEVIYRLVNRYVDNGSVLTQLEKNKRNDRRYIENKRRHTITPAMEHLLIEQYKDNNLSTLKEYRKILNEHDYDCSFSTIWRYFKRKD